MKKIVFLLSSLLIVTFSAFCQRYTTISSVPPIKKGKIVLQDGTSYKFKDLLVKNDSVEFSSADANRMKFANKDLYKVIKYSTYAGSMALSFGIGTIVAAPLLLAIPSENRGSAFGYYFAVMGGVTGLATLMGWAFKKEVVMYKNNQTVSFYPSIYFDGERKCYPSLTIALKISN